MNKNATFLIIKVDSQIMLINHHVSRHSHFRFSWQL